MYIDVTVFVRPGHAALRANVAGSGIESVQLSQPHILNVLRHLRKFYSFL